MTGVINTPRRVVARHIGQRLNKKMHDFTIKAGVAAGQVLNDLIDASGSQSDNGSGGGHCRAQIRVPQVHAAVRLSGHEMRHGVTRCFDIV